MPIRLLSLVALLALPLLAQGSGRVTGSVVDPSGTPVPGAAVSLLLSGQSAPVLTTTTTLDGLFYITGVRPEYYDLAIESAGFSKHDLVVRQAQINVLQVMDPRAADFQVVERQGTHLQQRI